MCQLLQELLSLCKPVHCTAWCILSALNAWVALNLERLWRGENPWITESMPIHPRLDWPKIIFTNSFWMSQVASSCLYCAAVCVCGNTFRGRAAAHNKLIVGKEDAHNELPIIRFWRRSAKLYIYLLYKKTKRPHLQIKSNSSRLLLRKGVWWSLGQCPIFFRMINMNWPIKIEGGRK